MNENDSSLCEVNASEENMDGRSTGCIVSNRLPFDARVFHFSDCVRPLNDCDCPSPDCVRHFRDCVFPLGNSVQPFCDCVYPLSNSVRHFCDCVYPLSDCVRHFRDCVSPLSDCVHPFGDCDAHACVDWGRDGDITPRPSLRTGRAVFPHPALQSVVYPCRGLVVLLFPGCA